MRGNPCYRELPFKAGEPRSPGKSYGCLGPRALFPCNGRYVPLWPDSISSCIQSVFQLKTTAQCCDVTAARSSTCNETVWGWGGRQRATAVAGSWRDQLHLNKNITGTVNAHSVLFFSSALASCASHIAFIFRLKRTVPLDFQQLRTLDAVCQTKRLVHYHLRFSSWGCRISGRPTLAQPWVMWLGSIPYAARGHRGIPYGATAWDSAFRAERRQSCVVGGLRVPGGQWNRELACEHKGITYQCTQQHGRSLIGARWPHHTWIQRDLKEQKWFAEQGVEKEEELEGKFSSFSGCSI